MGGKIIKTINKIIVASGLVAFIILLYLLVLLIAIGFSPSPLFVVHNHDVTNHTVVIEVFNENNESIIKETYELEPKSDISRKRTLWLWMHTKKEYKFKVTIDDKITEISKLSLPHRGSMVNIRLYYEDYTGKITPISVETVYTL